MAGCLTAPDGRSLSPSQGRGARTPAGPRDRPGPPQPEEDAHRDRTAATERPGQKGSQAAPGRHRPGERRKPGERRLGRRALRGGRCRAATADTLQAGMAGTSAVQKDAAQSGAPHMRRRGRRGQDRPSPSGAPPKARSSPNGALFKRAAAQAPPGGGAAGRKAGCRNAAVFPDAAARTEPAAASRPCHAGAPCIGALTAADPSGSPHR